MVIYESMLPFWSPVKFPTDVGVAGRFAVLIDSIAARVTSGRPICPLGNKGTPYSLRENLIMNLHLFCLTEQPYTQIALIGKHHSPM